MVDADKISKGKSAKHRSKPARKNPAKWKIVLPEKLSNNLFLIVLLLGIIIGIITGFVVRQADSEFRQDARNMMYLAFPGKLLLRMLNCMIIPLIVTSLISGMSQIPEHSASRLGGLMLIYYMGTTFLAACLGIALVSMIEPGKRNVKESVRVESDKVVKPVDTFLDLVRNAFPDNIVEACTMQTGTTYEIKEVKENVTGPLDEPEFITKIFVGKHPGTNILGLVVFSLTLGVVVGQMGDAGLPVRNVVESLEKAILNIVKLIIWYSPLGVVFILAERIVLMTNPVETFAALAWYLLTVLLGLFLHSFIVLPLIYFACVKSHPFGLMFKVSQALLTALATASSAATLPVTLQNLEEKAGVDKRITRFMVPVGTTINMDGTALYEGVASIFIAQYNHLQLNISQMLTIGVTATVAAIGAAGIPEAGIAMMVIVLTAVGLPSEDIGLIFAVDWLVDRFRTAVNVWGDCIGVGCMTALVKDTLRKDDYAASVDSYDSLEDAEFFGKVHRGTTFEASHTDSFKSKIVKQHGTRGVKKVMLEEAEEEDV